MLDLQEIENTIHELENGDTTFDTCIKLSALYIVQEHLKGTDMKVVTPIPNNVVKELSDIIPSYENYVQVKTNYQLTNSGKETVIKQMQFVCKEISEFISTLYSSTDMPEERELLYNSIQKELQNMTI